MKLLILLFTTITTAQTFTFTQDAKLAFLSDDYGNEAFTPNLTFKAQVHDFKNDVGEVTVGIKVEWADLSSGNYLRYGVEAGHSIDINPVKITPLVGYGILTREGFTFQSFEFGGETSVKLTDHFSIVGLHTYTQRPEWQIWRYSFHLGLQYKL